MHLIRPMSMGLEIKPDNRSATDTDLDLGKGPRMIKSIDYRGRGARLARRDEGAYCWYVTEEQRSQPGCIGREGD